MHPIVIPSTVARAACAVLFKVIPRHTTLPVLSHVRIEREGRFIRLSGSNLDQALTYEYPVEPEPLTPLGRTLAETRWKREACAILVPRSVLAEALKAAKSGDLIISEAAIGYTLIDQPVSRPFEAMAVEDFPPIPAPRCAKLTKLNESARVAMIRALASVSQDASRHVLNGAYLESEHDGQAVCTSVVATDGRRLYHALLPDATGLGGNIIIPTAALRLLESPALLACDWYLSADPSVPPNSDDEHGKAGVARFKAGPWTLTTKLIEGNYPNWRVVMPSIEGAMLATLNEQTHARLIEILTKLPKPPENSVGVDLVFTGRELHVHDPASKITAVVCGVPASAPAGMAVNRYYLVDLLTAGPGTFRITDEMAPLAYDANGKSVQVLMPMRADGRRIDVPDPQCDELRAKWEGKTVLLPHSEAPGEVTRVHRLGCRIVADVKVGAERLNDVELTELTEVAAKDVATVPSKVKETTKRVKKGSKAKQGATLTRAVAA